MSKLMVTLVSFPCESRHEVSIARLPKRQDGEWKRPRCHTLRYSTRAEALNGYWRAAGRLAEMNRLHHSSAIEN